MKESNKPLLWQFTDEFFLHKAHTVVAVNDYFIPLYGKLFLKLTHLH